MGEVIGYLRPEKATYGEKLVLQKLESSLPPDFTIYVECPLHDDRLERFPDFIILANEGGDQPQHPHCASREGQTSHHP